MTILLTGGGTGGHITPILAVAHELKKSHPSCHIIYIGERNGKYVSMVQDSPDIDDIVQIFAGKFRRYHGESWLRRMLDIKTNLLNLRDSLLVLLGSIQSLYIVRSIKPQVIFLKGGFVGVPVGLAAAFWRKPIVTHDSDALPGLANRIVSRWANVHATAMPADYYSYPKDKTRQVGVLVTSSYRRVTQRLRHEYRQEIGIPNEAEYLMITGGSGGAQAINQAVVKIIPSLLKKMPKLHIVHTTGIGKLEVYKNYSHPRLLAVELLKDMYIYSGAADLIVTRAGANTLAEFGTQAKACIVIPNPFLTGGHQLKNADYIRDNNAAEVVDESTIKTNPDILEQKIINLFADVSRRNDLANNLRTITVPDAAKSLARLLVEVAEQ